MVQESVIYAVIHAIHRLAPYLKVHVLLPAFKIPPLVILVHGPPSPFFF